MTDAERELVVLELGARVAAEMQGHPVRRWVTPTRQGKAELARRWQELQALNRRNECGQDPAE